MKVNKHFCNARIFPLYFTDNNSRKTQQKVMNELNFYEE